MSPSKHRAQRWRYILWSCLLLVSLLALALWELPGKSGTAKLHLIVAIQDAPKGSKASLWAGPKARAREVEQATVTPWKGEGVIDETIHLHVAYRRCLKLTIPRKTSDLVVLKVTPPSGQPRYLAIPFDQEWTLGALKPGSRTGMKLHVKWDGLWNDFKTPIRVES